LDTLCDTLWEHDHDSRLKPDQKKKIAQMYFPFVLLLIDKLEWVVGLPAESEEKKKALLCFLSVVKGTADTLLETYWKKETEKRIGNFFYLLQLALDSFEVR